MSIKPVSIRTAAVPKEKLRFEIPLENEKMLVLFCDVNLLDLDGKKTFLPSFPVTAPYLKESSNF